MRTKRARKSAPPDTQKFVEFALQIRIGDLLHRFKQGRDKRCGMNLGFSQMRCDVFIDLTDDTRPVATIRTAEYDAEAFVSQVVPLWIYPPALGGWSAEFLCPLVREDGSRCGKKIRCIYLPAPYAGRQWGCRHCNRLKYLAQTKRTGLAKKLRERRQKEQVSRPQNRQANRGRDLIPLEVPDVQWFSEVPVTEQEMLLMEFRANLRK